MDPFIEGQGKWEDFHNKLLGDIERLLSQTLPTRYTVRLGERRWSTRSFCRGRSRGLAAAAGEDFPTACGKRRRRAAAPRSVRHLPARDELGGLMTARGFESSASGGDDGQR